MTALVPCQGLWQEIALQTLQEYVGFCMMMQLELGAASEFRFPGPEKVVKFRVEYWDFIGQQPALDFQSDQADGRAVASSMLADTSRALKDTTFASPLQAQPQHTRTPILRHLAPTSAKPKSQPAGAAVVMSL